MIPTSYTMRVLAADTLKLWWWNQHLARTIAAIDAADAADAFTRYRAPRVRR